MSPFRRYFTLFYQWPIQPAITPSHSDDDLEVSELKIPTVDHGPVSFDTLVHVCDGPWPFGTIVRSTVVPPEYGPSLRRNRSP